MKRIVHPAQQLPGDELSAEEAAFERFMDEYDPEAPGDDEAGEEPGTEDVPEPKR